MLHINEFDRTSQRKNAELVWSENICVFSPFQFTSINCEKCVIQLFLQKAKDILNKMLQWNIVAYWQIWSNVVSCDSVPTKKRTAKKHWTWSANKWFCFFFVFNRDAISSMTGWTNWWILLTVELQQFNVARIYFIDIYIELQKYFSEFRMIHFLWV